MTALLNRVGDRLLGALLPEAKASACTWYPGYCYQVHQECYGGSACTYWSQCGTESPGSQPFCHVDPPGSYDYNYWGCC